ncbi:TipAS antibiotic-recognition domain-containing protein [Nonomuraea sp. NPDC050643]|uniref:TipAS antibiotic-recognition domain-containing protein n=1 Tax=Nonomuraea sp. NPDC050643 TaxID=3155660 RepID=UPI0034047CE4
MTANLKLTANDRAELFGDFDPDEHAAEAERRWGDSPAWAEATRPTSSFTKEDWKCFMAEAGDISARMEEAMRSGAPADGDQAMDLAEEHRAHITRWCYTCTYEIHRGLGDMYVSDARFTTAIDRTAPGLAAYYQAAISANATRNNP